MTKAKNAKLSVMVSFFKISTYFTIYTTCELLCLTIAFFCLRSDKTLRWRFFWVYLAITLAVELGSIYLKQHGSLKTTWLYSILLIFEIGFLTSLFYEILSKYVQKWTYYTIAVGSLFLLYVVEIILHKGIEHRLNLTNSALGILVVIASLSYLYFLLKDDDNLRLARDPNFWWVVGSLFFYFGFMSLNILYPMLKGNFSKPGILFGYTFKLLNVIFYATWSYAFICRKWMLKN